MMRIRFAATIAALAIACGSANARDESSPLTVANAVEQVQSAIDAAADSVPEGYKLDHAKVTLKITKQTQGTGEISFAVDISDSFTPTSTQTLTFNLKPQKKRASISLGEALADGIISASQQIKGLKTTGLAVSDFTVTSGLQVENIIKAGVKFSFLGLADISLGGSSTKTSSGEIEIAYSVKQ